MKEGNDGTGNTEDRDDWETPDVLFNLLNKQYGFKLDCCASVYNSKCDLSYSINNSFLDLEKTISFLFSSIAWMNPPFSKARIMFEQFFKIIKNGVAIYRCDNMETKVWQEVILKNASWIFIPKGRIAYQYNISLRNGKGSRFPSALIGFNVELIKHLEGTTLIINKR